MRRLPPPRKGEWLSSGATGNLNAHSDESLHSGTSRDDHSDGPQSRQQHSGWAARQGSAGRRQAPSVEGCETDFPGGGVSKSDVGSSASGARVRADSGPDSTVQVLRCMYTNQKTKKRKVWSDGAVKCCSKNQRVSLFRWSEVLGVTDKLLGEIYLSVPEFKAFISGGEPELEMELYIVSLDGVIQDTQAAAAEASTGDATAENSKRAGLGLAANGRKRKLLKPFKAPARRAPPAAPPEDPWAPSGDSGRRLGHNGSVGSLETRGSRGERRTGMTTSGACYNGFGQVASLWDDDEEGEGGAEDPGEFGPTFGGGDRDVQHTASSTSRNIRVVEDEFVDQRRDKVTARAMQLSAEAASIAGGRGVDGRRAAPDGSYYSSHSSSEGDLGRHAVLRQHHRGEGAYGECVNSGSSGQGLGNREREPNYSSRLPAETMVGEERGRRAEGVRYDGKQTEVGRDDRRDGGDFHDAESRHRPQSHAHQEKENVLDETGSSHHGAIRHDQKPQEEQQQHDDFHPRVVGSTEDDLSEYHSRRRSNHGSHGDGGGGGGDGSAVREELGARSTQDILSLFGGFGEDSPPPPGQGDEPSPGTTAYSSPGTTRLRRPETADTRPETTQLRSDTSPSTLPFSRAEGDQDAGLEAPRRQPGKEQVPSPTKDATDVPLVSGRGSAADMRRKQKAAREEAQRLENASDVVGVDASQNTSMSATTAPADADESTMAPWSCAICGVLAAASASSCRVCGAKRPKEVEGCRQGGGAGEADAVVGGGVSVEDDGGDRRYPEEGVQYENLRGDEFSCGDASGPGHSRTPFHQGDGPQLFEEGLVASENLAPPIGGEGTSRRDMPHDRASDFGSEMGGGSQHCGGNRGGLSSHDSSERRNLLSQGSAIGGGAALVPGQSKEAQRFVSASSSGVVRRAEEGASARGKPGVLTMSVDMGSSSDDE